MDQMSNLIRIKRIPTTIYQQLASPNGHWALLYFSSLRPIGGCNIKLGNPHQSLAFAWPQFYALMPFFLYFFLSSFLSSFLSLPFPSFPFLSLPFPSFPFLSLPFPSFPPSFFRFPKFLSSLFNRHFACYKVCLLSFTLHFLLLLNQAFLLPPLPSLDHKPSFCAVPLSFLFHIFCYCVDLCCCCSFPSLLAHLFVYALRFIITVRKSTAAQVSILMKMIQRKVRKAAVVVISCTVMVNSIGQKSKNIEMEQNGTEIVQNGDKNCQLNGSKSPQPKQMKLISTSSADNIRKVQEKMRQNEERALEERCNDVYSKDFVPKRYAKNSDEYGRPPPGSLTEMRAKKASKHIAREMLQLCEVIEEYGHRMKRGGNKNKVVITFGDLFSVYQFISDKVVGILLRARKHGMVDFDGEMLYQRRDEQKLITLLLSHEQIQQALEEF